jgi:hypothetical protein
VVLSSKINPYYVSFPHQWKEDYISECNLTLNTVQNSILPWDKSASQKCAELSWYVTRIYLQAGCGPYIPPHNHLHPTVSARNTTHGIHLNNPHILMPFIQSLGFLHFTVLRGNFWSEKWKSLLEFLCSLKTFHIPEMLTQSFLRNSSACGWSCSTACATSITNSCPLWYLQQQEILRTGMGVISNSAARKPQFLALLFVGVDVSCREATCLYIYLTIYDPVETTCTTFCNIKKLCILLQCVLMSFILLS